MGPLELIVCARHGHDFMGWKSPVHYLERGQYDNFKSTSRKQGAEGRPTCRKKLECTNSRRFRRTCEPTDRNCIVRPNPRASQHNMTKPIQIAGGG